MSAMPQGGLGGLAGLGGGEPQAPAPEELLAQIRSLLDQYLAMGDSTPVAEEAQNLAQAIDETAGAAAPEGGEPTGFDTMGGTDEGANPLPDEMEEPPAQPEAKSYDQANEGALARLKKRNKDQGR